MFVFFALASGCRLSSWGCSPYLILRIFSILHLRWLAHQSQKRYMRTVKLDDGNFFSIHETQKQLKINRFTDFQKYVLQDSGIGSTTAQIDEHFKMLDSFLGSEQLEEARRERHNLHIGMYLQINRINIKHLSFACLIDSINGEPLTDFSEANLRLVCDQLGEMGLTEQMVSDILEGVKKNLIQS